MQFKPYLGLKYLNNTEDLATVYKTLFSDGEELLSDEFGETEDEENITRKRWASFEQWKRF